MDSEPEPEPEPDDVETTVEGNLTNASTDDPIEGAEVAVIRIDEDEQVGDGTTGTDGSYEVSFTVSEDNTPDQLRVEGDADGFLAAADTVDFSESVTSDLTLEEAVQSEVSGQITNDDTGEGIDGATVTGTDHEENQLFETTTDANGQYTASLELAEAPDQITVKAADEDFEGTEETVQFAEEISLNFALSPEVINVLVDGTVMSEDDGQRIEDATIEGFRPDEDALLADTTTVRDGSYELSFTVKAPQAPDDLRIEVTGAFGYEDQDRTVSFSSALTEDFSLATAPIEISSVEELQRIETEENYPLDGDYVLTEDIDASETETWNDGQGFNPIGDGSDPFNGSLDGNGFTISNLFIRGGIRVGLFGDVEKGEVVNLALSNVDITGKSRVGGIAGEVGEFAAGGVTGEISESEVSGTVRKEAGPIGPNGRVGGIVGHTTSGGGVRNCSFEGTVLGNDIMGGVVGLNSGVVAESSSEGEVRPREGGGGKKLGGLVGSNEGEGKIVKSHTSSDVSNGSPAGGVAGMNLSSASIDKTYSSGDVSGSEKVGGLVGRNDGGNISESYTTGGVTGDEDVGGVAGLNEGTLSSTFWDTEATSQDFGVGRGDFDGTTGLTTDEMQGESAEENMDGFDFQDTWQVVTDPDDYPALFWEDI